MNITDGALGPGFTEIHTITAGPAKWLEFPQISYAKP
jgi:hypothetical protein